MNTTMSSLAPLLATNPSSVVRMHGYDLPSLQALQAKVLCDHHGDS